MKIIFTADDLEQKEVFVDIDTLRIENIKKRKLDLAKAAYKEDPKSTEIFFEFSNSFQYEITEQM